jgi:hypothetical protein
MNAGTLTAMDRTAIYQIRVATSSNLVYETAPNASFRTLAAVEKLTTANAWDAYVDHTMTEFDGTNVTIWSASPFTGASMSAGNTVVIVGPARTYMEINKNFGDGVNSLGDFEAVDEIPEINIKIDSKVINAVTRKLKAVWDTRTGTGS